jgi:hypothetical protein
MQKVQITIGYDGISMFQKNPGRVFLDIGSGKDVISSLLNPF